MDAAQKMTEQASTSVLDRSTPLVNAEDEQFPGEHFAISRVASICLTALLTAVTGCVAFAHPSSTAPAALTAAGGPNHLHFEGSEPLDSR